MKQRRRPLIATAAQLMGNCRASISAGCGASRSISHRSGNVSTVAVAHGTAVGVSPPSPKSTERSRHQLALRSSYILCKRLCRVSGTYGIVAGRDSSKSRRLLPTMGVFRQQKSLVELP